MGAAMKGDRVEIVIEAGGTTKTYEVVATKAGRRVEVVNRRGVFEVTEVTRSQPGARTGRAPRAAAPRAVPAGRVRGRPRGLATAGLRARHIDPRIGARRPVVYRLAGLWLDDAEFAELMRELTRVLQPRMANPPRPGHTRRILGYVLLPGTDSAPEKAGFANSGRYLL
jgi:hypothetical protein